MRNDGNSGIPAAIQSVYDAGDDRLRAVAVSPAEGMCLKRMVEADGVFDTLEVGCAYGLSSMFICDSLARKNARCLHTIIDPYQSSVFAGSGVKNLEAADLRCFQLIEEPSELALPRLVSAGANFDAVLVDGYHTFDQTMLDLYYATKLLRVGGYLALDDCNLPAVNRAARYLLTYPCYRVVDSTPHENLRRKVLTGAKWVIATLLKPLTWSLGRLSYEFLDGSLIDARILRVAETSRMLILQKVSKDERWAWWFEYF